LVWFRTTGSNIKLLVQHEARELLKQGQQQKDSMEILELLQKCNKRTISFRKAFYQLGMTKPHKQLKALDEEGEFAALANWIIHNLPPFHSTELRLKVDGAIYQASICWEVVLTTGELETLTELLEM